MGIVRNFIDITGITPEDEFPKEIRGKLIKASEIENTFIGNVTSDIKNIYQIVIDIQVKNIRSISINAKKTIVIDCVKLLNIIYYNNDNMVKVIELKVPYNTSIEVDEKEEIDYTNIYIGDAYFELVNKDTLYSYIMYFINVGYSKNTNIFKQEKKNIKSIYGNTSNNDLNYKDDTTYYSKIVGNNEDDNEYYGMNKKDDNIINLEKNNIFEEMSVSKDSSYIIKDDLIKTESKEDNSLTDLEEEYL